MNLSVVDFLHLMHDAKVTRVSAVWDPKKKEVVVSHPSMTALRAFLAADKVDYDEHEGIFLQLSPSTGVLMGAFVWKTNRGQACGGIRMREYKTMEEYLRDGIRLAIGMGRKNALAGLWWGGGKGVIALPATATLHAGGKASTTNGHVCTLEDLRPGSEKRNALMRDYGDFLTSLRGCYVAAEDAGVTVADVDIVFSRSRFTTCISPTLGGSGNPSVPTAMGLTCAMEGALESLGLGTLVGKSVAIQGCGNVGRPLIGFLLKKGVKKIISTDSDAEKINAAKELYGNHSGGCSITLKTVAPGDLSVLAEDVDIVSPCAYGGVLNETTVPKIRAKIVCGAANNQLLDPHTDYGMHAKGIWYVPDYVCNRMGIVNCADEQFGQVGPLGGFDDPRIARHLGRDWDNAVFNIVKKVFERARKDKITTAEAADRLSNEAVVQPHPIWGHRSQQIIDALMAENWAAAV